MIVDGGISRGQVRWQAPVHRRVKEFGRLSEEEFAEVVERQPGLLHRVGDVHGLEVAAVVNVASLAIDQRVISRCR